MLSQTKEIFTIRLASLVYGHFAPRPFCSKSKELFRSLVELKNECIKQISGSERNKLLHLERNDHVRNDRIQFSFHQVNQF